MINEKLEKLNQEIAKGEARLRRAQHEEKILEHQVKQLTRKERTHRALYQRSYAGKFPFKAGSADRRGCDGHSETGIFSKWHEGNSCRKRERAGSRGIPYGVRAATIHRSSRCVAPCRGLPAESG